MSRWHAESGYVARYLGTGAANTLVGFATIFALMWGGVSPTVANVCGYAVGLVTGFVLAKTVVFRSSGRVAGEGLRYTLAFAAAFVSNLVVLRTALGPGNLNAYLAQVLAAGTYTFLMYVMSRYLVFRPSGARWPGSAGAAARSAWRHARKLFLALGALAALAVAACFLQVLQPNIGTAAATTVAAFTFFVASAALLLIAREVRAFAAVAGVVIVLAAVAGVYLAAGSGPAAPRLGLQAWLLFSDGSRSEPGAPGRITEWGRQVDGFSLHPPFGSTRVPFELTATLAAQPKELDLLFSKPRDSLLGPDGKPTASDGVSVVITARDAAGVETVQRYSITQPDFVRERWLSRRLEAPAGIAQVKVVVSTGPPGSTPDYDSTLVGFASVESGIPAWLAAALGSIGKSLLVAWGLGVLALYGALHVADRSAPAAPWRAGPWLRRYAGPLGMAAAMVLLAYAVAASTSFVFFWDYRNYWEKTEVLYELLAAGAWLDFVKTVASAYTADYSLMPAILPALGSLPFGYPVRVQFTTLIALLYAVPAYLSVIHLARRMHVGNAMSTAASPWVLPTATVFLGLPLFFGTVLYLMPDIGGVVLFVGALLHACAIASVLADAGTQGSQAAPPRQLLKASLGLAVCICAMFLFRRWYVFASVSVLFALAVLVAVDAARRRRAWRPFAAHLAMTALYVSFACLPLLAWVLFEWSAQPSRHDYTALYAGYKDGLAVDLEKTLRVFGAVPLCAGVAGMLLAFRKPGARRLAFLLCLATALACVLFLRVQSPGQHHFYLLMPWLGAAIAFLALEVGRRYGKAGVVGLLAALVLGQLAATVGPRNSWSSLAMPGLREWLPRQQPHANAYAEIGRWLGAPENQRPLCIIASGGTINESVFWELWQVVPALERKSLLPRILPMGQVDTVNGPPTQRFRECEIALVAVPFQHHLRSGEQYTLEILHDELLDGSGIGAAFRRGGERFQMDPGLELLVFRRVRPITDSEYAALVERFLRAKGPTYVNPAR